MRLKEPIRCVCGECNSPFVRHRNRGDMAVCTPCQKKRRASVWRQENPERDRENGRKWSASNREKDRAMKAAWQKRNPAKEAAKAAKWRAANIDKVKEITKRHYWNHREKIIQSAVERNAKHRTPLWANLDRIEKIYCDSRRLSITTGVPHHVDHIVPIKGTNVCGLHVETNLRVITVMENIRKSNKFTEANP